MTTYYAYDHNLPCKNPSCKSYGRPHPGCMCYGNMAEGGEAGFCSSDRAHESGCEYFSDGGEVDPNDVIPDDAIHHVDEIDPNDVIPDDINPEDVTPDGGNDENLDLSPAALQDRMRQAANPESTGKNTLGRAIGSAAEGVAQGFAGPAATGTELALSKLGVPNMSAEDIKAREADFPVLHAGSEALGLGAGLMSGVGEAGLAMKGAELLPGVAKLAELGKVGRAGAGAVKAFVGNFLIQGGDETTKGILGEGDPAHPVGAALAHMGLSGLLAAPFGALGSLASKAGGEKLAAEAEAKLGGKITSYLAGFGHAAEGTKLEPEAFEKAFGREGASYDLYHQGQKSFDNMIKTGIKNAAAKTASYGSFLLGEHYGGPGAGVAAKAAADFVGKPVASLIGKVVSPAAKRIIGPVTLKILSTGETSGLLDVLNHAEQVSKGFNMVDKAVKSVMTGAYGAGTSALVSDKNRSERERAEADKAIADDPTGQDLQDLQQDQLSAPVQAFAEGGEAEPMPRPVSGTALHYPDQNMLLSAAKGRITSYLQSLRPPEHHAKLAFDDAPDMREQKKSYHKALDVALKPLSVMSEIQKGTVEPDHVRHLNAMYPELSGLLQKKLTEEIVKHQVDGKKPPYRVRQGLSMFLGTPLSGELKPESIQAAQAVFAPTKSQPSPEPSQGNKGSKKTSALSKSDESYLTGSQALQRRGQKM